MWSNSCPPPQAPLSLSSHADLYSAPHTPDHLESEAFHNLFLLIGIPFPVLFLVDFSSYFRLSLDATSSRQSFLTP